MNIQLTGEYMDAYDWYEYLRPDVRDDAIYEAQSQERDGTECDSLAEAINSFDWYETNGGDEYWREIYDDILSAGENSEFLDPHLFSLNSTKEWVHNLNKAYPGWYTSPERVISKVRLEKGLIGEDPPQTEIIPICIALSDFTETNLIKCLLNGEFSSIHGLNRGISMNSHYIPFSFNYNKAVIPHPNGNEKVGDRLLNGKLETTMVEGFKVFYLILNKQNS